MSSIQTAAPIASNTPAAIMGTANHSGHSVSISAQNAPSATTRATAAPTRAVTQNTRQNRATARL